MKLLRYLSIGVILFSAMQAPALAHSGGTDVAGCYTNKKTGEYHCHGGAKTKSAKTEAKSSARVNANTVAKGMECASNLYNCSDFSSHSQAQGVYESCLQQVGDDVHDLDRDNDGVACESLQ